MQCFKLLVRYILLGSTALFFSISSANAELSEANDPVFGIGSLTIDSSTDLAWLDMKYTDPSQTSYPYLLSYSNISNQFGPGQDFEGFRFATTAEVLAFMINAGIQEVPGTSPDNVAPILAFYGLVGTTNDPSETIVQATTGSLNSSNRPITVYAQSSGTVALSSTSQTSQNSSAASWLVKQAPPPPPEFFTGTYTFGFSDHGAGTFKYDGVTGEIEILQYDFGTYGSGSTSFGTTLTANVFGTPPFEFVVQDNTFFGLNGDNSAYGLRLTSGGTFCVRPDLDFCGGSNPDLATGTYSIALIVPGEITAGDNVIVIPKPVDEMGDPVENAPEVLLTFDSVSDAGDSSGVTTVQVIDENSESAPILPLGFQLSGTTKFLNITTPASFTSVEVCIGYDESAVDEDNLELLHQLSDDSWEVITNPDSPDIIANTICGTTSSFSFFASTSVNNEAPVAVPGAAQSIRAGDLVSLDGSNSFDDNTASADLGYSWSFSSLPEGSTAALANEATATPSFVADVTGTFEVELIVTDEGGLLSSPGFVEIGTTNLAPTAITGDDRLVIIGTAVALDGSSSTDPEADSLIFDWSITFAPVGSMANITNSGLETAVLTPDLEGEYEVTLTVSDFLGAGTPDSMLIMATTAQGFAENRILIASSIVSGLEKYQFTKKGNQKKFLKDLSKVVKYIQKADAAKAAKKLEKLIQRTDGCATNGSPDGKGKGRDWITDCAEQAVVMSYLTEALDALVP